MAEPQKFVSHLLILDTIWFNHMNLKLLLFNINYATVVIPR